MVGSKQSAPTASTSTNSLTVGTSSVLKQSVMSSSNQDSDVPASHDQAQAEGHEPSAEAGATASGQFLDGYTMSFFLLWY